MRVALVVPPVKDFYFTPQRASFLGVRTIAALLRERGIEHAVFNGVRSRGRPIPLPEELSYLDRYVGSTHFFSGFHRFGIREDFLAGQVASYGPDLVLVSCFAFGYANETIETIAAIKRLSPRSYIVAGGAGVSAYPEYFIRNSQADAAVRGQAEDCIDMLIRDPGEAPGACSRTAGGALRSIPAYTHDCPFKPVMMKTRESRDAVYYAAMISRGCPRRCSFCSVRLTFPGYRRAARDDVLAMIGTIPRTDKRVHVNFEDDSLLVEFDGFMDVLDALASHTRGRFSFSMENGTEFALLDADRIRALKRLGVTRLNLPLVSRDERILTASGRRGDADSYAAVAATCRRYDIPVTAYIIAGLPGDTIQSVRAGVDYLLGLDVLVSILPFYPVPGIAGYESTSYFDSISPRLCTGAAFYPWHGIGTDDLVDLFRTAREAALRAKK